MLKSPFSFICRTTNAHGTGCSLASAIAAELAKGASVPDAVRTAKHYVWRLLERSVGLPFGEGDQKPMNHGYKIADWRAEIEAGAAIAQEVAAATAAALGDELSPQNTSSSGLPTPVNVPRRIANPVDVRLYAVTDTELIKKSGRTLSEAVMLCADGGATVVQLREKGCDGGEYRERAMLAAAACRSAGIPLIVNDRVDVAMAVQADGVHVGQGDLPAAAVRRLIGPDMILGVSVKTVQQALAAEAAGADYLGAGACFTTGTKDSSVIGVDGLRDICEAVNIPVVAIGGIGPSNAGEVLASGCDGVAAVSAIFGAKNVVDAARELRMIVDGVIKSRDENKSDV